MDLLSAESQFYTVDTGGNYTELYIFHTTWSELVGDIVINFM